MQRHCTQCGHALTARDLAWEESQGMEAERRALGLEGVKFRYYICPVCDHADIFVHVLPLPDESWEDFQQRRDELEQTVQQLPRENVEVVLVAS
jgi:hypothetical protein